MDYIVWLLQTHGRNGVVLDTNILLLYIVGALDPALLERIKRTRQFDRSDYEILRNLCHLVSRIIVTPGILAESCNLLESANSRYDSRLFEILQQLLQAQLGEWHTKASVLSENPIFRRFGFTDASMADLATQGCVVLSDDLRLNAALAVSGHPVMNFNHLRSAEWIR